MAISSTAMSAILGIIMAGSALTGTGLGIYQAVDNEVKSRESKNMNELAMQENRELVAKQEREQKAAIGAMSPFPLK